MKLALGFTVVAICVAVSCKNEKTVNEEDLAVTQAELDEELANPFLGSAVNPNLEQLRYTMRAFTDESTHLDHQTLAVTLEALAQALHGIPYADTSDDAVEVHRVAEVLRTMGPSSVQRTEAVREALRAAVAALNKAAVDPRYEAQRPMIANLSRQIDMLDGQKPILKQSFQVKLAICDTANTIAVMPTDGTTKLPCTSLPTSTAVRDMSNADQSWNLR